MTSLPILHSIGTTLPSRLHPIVFLLAVNLAVSSNYKDVCARRGEEGYPTEEMAEDAGDIGSKLNDVSDNQLIALTIPLWQLL